MRIGRMLRNAVAAVVLVAATAVAQDPVPPRDSLAADSLRADADTQSTTDKLLDTWYLGIEWLVAMRWENPFGKWIAFVLFPYRVIGVALFEVTGERMMLFVFPNLFENWWLYCVITARNFPRFEPRTWRSSLVVLGILLIPKMIQEYILHFAEAQPWDWIKRHTLGSALRYGR